MPDLPATLFAEADGARFELRQVDKMAARLKTELLNIGCVYTKVRKP